MVPLVSAFGAARRLAGARRSRDLAAILGLLALAFALYHPALGLFWHADDFYNLRFSRHHTPLQVLASPATWGELPFKMVTPLMFLSFQLDLALAGSSTTAFYLHQILAVSLCAALLFAALRLWIAPLPSFLGAALFLLGAPTGALAATLMVRHYPEGIALMLLALAAFVLALRRGSGGGAHLGWGMLSAALYAAACLAKEIAVPLPLGLLLLPEGDLRRRLRAALPHGVVLVSYLAYRRTLLGTWGGGYGWAVEKGEWPGLALALPFKMAREMAGGGGVRGWSLVGLALLAAGLGVLAARRPLDAAGRWLAALVLALLPILPVSIEMTPRYAAAPWALLAAAAALGGARLATTPPLSARAAAATGPGLVGALSLLGLAVVGFFAWRVSWGATLAAAERTSVENRAYLRLSAGDLLLRPLGYPASMAELRLFAGEGRGGAPGPWRTRAAEAPATWAYDELAICPPRAGVRVWEYDPAAKRVVARSADQAALCAAWRGRVRPDAALNASFRAGAEVLSWRLGPYPEGEPGGYALLIGDGAALFRVPRQGAFQRPPERLAFRVRYESPQGWVTYSPALVGDFARRPVLTWRRPAEAPAGPLPLRPAEGADSDQR